MFCVKCGKELPDSAKFCPVCGANLSEENLVGQEIPEAAEHKPEGVSVPRNVVIAISVLVVLWFGALLISKPHRHVWTEATCTQPKTCTVCGKTKGQMAAHVWEEATCLSPKKCKVCGREEGDVAEHRWIAATCSTPQTCSVCGKEEGSVLVHEPDSKGYCKLCREYVGTALTTANYSKYITYEIVQRKGDKSDRFDVRIKKVKSGAKFSDDARIVITYKLDNSGTKTEDTFSLWLDCMNDYSTYLDDGWKGLGYPVGNRAWNFQVTKAEGFVK